jgi:hypothetical protein
LTWANTPFTSTLNSFCEFFWRRVERYVDKPSIVFKLRD